MARALYMGKPQYLDKLQHLDKDLIHLVVNFIKNDEKQIFKTMSRDEKLLFMRILNLKNASNDKKCVYMFDFALKYGKLPIITYLYEECGMVFCTAGLNNYIKTFESYDGTDGSNVSQRIESSNSTNTTLTIMLSDKYSNDRQACIKYITNDIRMYSEMIAPNKITQSFSHYKLSNGKNMNQ